METVFLVLSIVYLFSAWLYLGTELTDILLGFEPFGGGRDRR